MNNFDADVIGEGGGCPAHLYWRKKKGQKRTSTLDKHGFYTGLNNCRLY